MKKIWEWIKNNYRLMGVLAAIILVLCGVIYFQYNQISDLKKEKKQTSQVLNALQDTMNVYQNKEKEWVVEKLTIQTSMKELEKINGLLNESQKEMFERIKKIENSNKVITAALIKTNIILDSLVAKNEMVVIDTTNKVITFQDSTDNLQYELSAFPVLPAYPDIKPTLTFNKFLLPNTQFIEFHWKDDRKSGYPVSFSVTNTNDYFKTINVESYAIPNIEHQSGFSKWMKENFKPLIYMGVGIVGGATVVAVFKK